MKVKGADQSCLFATWRHRQDLLKMRTLVHKMRLTFNNRDFHAHKHLAVKNPCTLLIIHFIN